MQIKLTMTNYIAGPFWPEKNLCIDIEKKSGANRQKTPEKRIAALKAQCDKDGITYNQYLEAQESAKRQWYTNKEGYIMIPRHQMAGACVEVIGGSPKALRGPFNKDNFRALVHLGDFVTTLKECDGVFERYVKLEGSNQRNFQSNEFVGEYLDQGQCFTATGVITLSDTLPPKTEDTVQRILRVAVEDVGIGASRKMGFGRGVVEFS